MHSLVAVAALDSAEGTRPTEEWIARAQRRLKSRTDVTPAALIAAIVTERGIHRAPFLDLSPAALRQAGSPAGALS